MTAGLRAVAVICGGGDGMWEQRAEAVRLVNDASLGVVSIAINEAGIAHPDPLEHWVTLHPRKLEGWERARAELGLPTDGYTKWSESWNRVIAKQAGVTGTARRWRDGSSGLTAVDVARNHLGLPAILCGVRMDDAVNIFRGQPWREAKRYWRGFKEAVPEFADHVRSMSGRTREVLGAPDLAWLAYIQGRIGSTQPEVTQ